MKTTRNGEPANIYPVIVDYMMSVEEAVKLGHYDLAHQSITSENFPTRREGKTKLEVEFVHFNRRISTEKALEELNQMRYRAVELRELLALGVQYPYLQREFLIVALGSIWQRPDGRHRVPCLLKVGSARYLHFSFVGGNIWPADCLFAVVRRE